MFITKNRNRFIPNSRKKSFPYASSDPILLLVLVDKVIGGDDEDPIVQEYCKIQDSKTNHIFETTLSSLSLKPDDVNKTDEAINNILNGVLFLFLFSIITFFYFILIKK